MSFCGSQGYQTVTFFLEWRMLPQLVNIFHSVQFSHSGVSDSLWPHGLQHARLPCLSPTPGAYSNSCPWSRWCHPSISSSVIPFSSHLQSVPASRSFPMSQFFASGSQSIEVSASASVLPVNVQDWFPLGLTGWISSQSKWLSRIFSLHSSKASILYPRKTKNWIHRILIFQSFWLLNIIIEKALKSKAISETVAKLNAHLFQGHMSCFKYITSLWLQGPKIKMLMPNREVWG